MNRRRIDDSIVKMAVAAVPGWAWAIMGIVSVVGIVSGTVLHFDVGATANKWMDFMLYREKARFEIQLKGVSPTNKDIEQDTRLEALEAPMEKLIERHPNL